MVDTTTTESRRDPSYSKLEKAWETIQTVGFILAIIVGSKKVQEGDKLPTGKEVPMWLINMFPSLIRDDETEYNLTRDSHPDPMLKKIESIFREHFIADGYDETKYRLNLIHMRREYIERMREVMPENKTESRMTFETKLKMKDSVTEFFSELIAENTAGGTPQEVYERQRKIALDGKLLEKSGWLGWVQKNKGKVLASLILFPFLLFAIIYQTLNFLLG